MHIKKGKKINKSKKARGCNPTPTTVIIRGEDGARRTSRTIKKAVDVSRNRDAGAR